MYVKNMIVTIPLGSNLYFAIIIIIHVIARGTRVVSLQIRSFVLFAGDGFSLLQALTRTITYDNK